MFHCRIVLIPKIQNSKFFVSGLLIDHHAAIFDLFSSSSTMAKTSKSTRQQKRKSTNTTLTTSKYRHRNARLRTMTSPHRPCCNVAYRNAVIPSIPPPTSAANCATAASCVVAPSIQHSNGGVIELESFDPDGESVKKIEAAASMLFNLCAVLIDSLGKNSSAKNVLTIAPATMKEQINSLVNGRNKILHESCSSDIENICQGQQTNVYDDVNNNIPSHPITNRSSKLEMAKIMVNAWETIKKIPSLFDFRDSRSLDICDFIGTMETFSDLHKTLSTIPKQNLLS